MVWYPSYIRCDIKVMPYNRITQLRLLFFSRRKYRNRHEKIVVNLEWTVEDDSRFAISLCDFKCCLVEVNIQNFSFNMTHPDSTLKVYVSQI